MYLYSGKMLSIFLMLLLTTSLFHIVEAQDKPLLSEAIQNTIDSDGVEAAKVHFTSMDSSERRQYEVDIDGISELTNAYLEDGHMEALMAISEITGVFMQDAVAESMEQYGSEMDDMQEQQEAEREQERETEQLQSIVERQGQPRDDLKRFTGVYGDPKNPESARQLWVNISCDGYLVSGAMWGDAAPWWMRSESENVFILEDSFNNIRMEFASGGTGLEMTHNLEFMESPLQRVAPLPDGWDSCMERSH